MFFYPCFCYWADEGDGKIYFCFLGFVQKREKRRWFRKPTNLNQQETATQQAQAPKATDHVSAANSSAAAEQKHVLAVAVATAEAAMATAQAAAEVARLTRPSNHAREHYYAIVIQTAFRGYLVGAQQLTCTYVDLKLRLVAGNVKMKEKGTGF